MSDPADPLLVPLSPPIPFTHASALAAAHELKRYLDVWHVDSPDDPPDCLTRSEGNLRLACTFRTLASKGRHLSNPAMEIITLYDKAERSDHPGCVGYIVPTAALPPCRTRALWLVREFLNRLAPRRDDPQWEYLTLTFDRILSELAFRERHERTYPECSQLIEAAAAMVREENPRYRIIAGKTVDAGILAEFIRAARSAHAVSTARPVAVLAPETAKVTPAVAEAGAATGIKAGPDEVTPERAEGAASDGDNRTYMAELTDRQRSILETMFSDEITGERRRKRRTDIVDLINRKHEPTIYSRDFSALVKLGYLGSLEGPRGGYWLTLRGKAEAQRLGSI